MNYTPEQQKDFEERAREFQADLEPMYTVLKQKHQVEEVYQVATVASPSGVYGLGVTKSIGDLKYKNDGVVAPSDVASVAAPGSIIKE